MKASELIKRLQRRIDLYGDLDCVVRYDEGEEEFDLSCVYADEDSERIVLSEDFDPDGEVEPDNDRTYEVTEVCPHCDAEVTMIWNTEINGFKAFCPHCGKRLMLCDECQHAVCQDGESRDCDYCSETDTCMYNHA